MKWNTEGIFLPPEQQTPENIAANIDDILQNGNQAMLFRCCFTRK